MGLRALSFLPQSALSTQRSPSALGDLSVAVVRQQPTVPPRSADGTSFASEIVSICLLSNQSELRLTRTPLPNAFSLSPSNVSVDLELVCAFWSAADQRWSTNGVRTVGHTCETTHFSDFAILALLISHGTASCGGAVGVAEADFFVLCYAITAMCPASYAWKV